MDLQRQLELLYDFFQGTFDNYQQVACEEEIKANEGIEPVHDWDWIKYFPVSIPKLGSHILLGRQGFRASGKLYRQRLYQFQISVKEGCVENLIYKLKDESLFEKAEVDPTIVANLDPQTDIECMEGCNVSWSYLPESNKFHGSTKEGMCRFDSKFFPGKTIIASSDIFVGQDELWTLDRGIDTDGNKMYGFKIEDHYKFIRCNLFRGKAVVDGSEEEIVIYDQGGKIDRGNYSVELARAHDKDKIEEVMKLSLIKNQEVVGVAVTSVSANCIGLKLGSVEIFLKRD